jgi:hypothetical protein
MRLCIRTSSGLIFCLAMLYSCRRFSSLRYFPYVAEKCLNERSWQRYNISPFSAALMWEVGTLSK